MRLLSLDEKDTSLFDSHVNRTLYTLYRENADSFTVMWEQQGTGFWLKFCISLRSVLKKQGFSIQLSAFELNHFETFCINIAKLLTGKSAEAVHTYVKDVVSVSRFHQLHISIPGAYISKLTEPTPAFLRLFGSPSSKGNIIKLFGTLPLHLRAVGCLLRLLERWLVAEAGDATDLSWWHVPEIWHHGNQHLASHFEIFLKKNWDSKLLSLLGVHPRDICWWNNLPKEDKVMIGCQRHTRLGSFIAAMSKKFDVPLSDCIGIMEDEIYYHHIIASCPRGKFRIFSTYSATVMFQIAFCRGLYLVDCMTAFHPFSQAIISFTNAAFASFFLWHGASGILSCFLRWEQEQNGVNSACAMNYRNEMEFLLHIISGHLIHARTAMALNSKFHDSLYGDVTWTSPVTLVRLPWNTPLLTNWLEVLLIQIYKFERFFIPLCHFPLNKDVVFLVESVYRKVSEAKFLVKTCLIIADGILKRKMQDASVGYRPRKLVSDVIPRLSHIMKFLERDAYRVLDVILRTGWNKEEQDDESNSLTDKVKVDLAAWNCVPNIDHYYSENFRCINYWISGPECSGIEGGEEFCTEAIEMLTDYKLGQKTPVKMKDPYKFTLFMECARSKHLNFANKSDDPAQDLFLFVTSILKLLQEDGWLSPLAQKGFFALFGLPHDLGHIEALNSKSNGSGEKIFEQMVNFAAVYYVASCLVGDTWQCKIAGQNALAQLQRNETLAIMADTGARLNILTHMSLGNVRCPPAQYFKDATAEVHKHSTYSSLSIEEATLLLESFEKEAVKKICVSTAEALTPVKVPSLEEMPRPSVGINWLKYLEYKRMQLLQLVSDQQFIATHSYVKSNLPSSLELFPLYDVLEHRLVEEMAGMQKCLKLGGLHYGPAYGLCRLLAHRFTWIQQSFVKWRKGKHTFKAPVPEFGSMGLRFSAIYTRVRMLAALIPLQALFFTYISKYRTTHPISEMTVSMFVGWTDVACLSSMTDALINMGDCLKDYNHALKQNGCEYFEQMLEHCHEVWVVAPFCSSPEAAVKFGSITHAQKIVTTFMQLYLMSYFIILLQNPVICEVDTLVKLQEKLVGVTMILRHVEIDDKVIPQKWPSARDELKKHLREIWSSLLGMRNLVGTSVHGAVFPRWLGNSSHIWEEYFAMFVGSHYRNILQKIAFSEFINTKGPKSDGGSSTNNEPVAEINNSKANTKHMPPADVPVKPGVTVSGPSNKRNSKTESSASVKGNTPDENVGNSDGTENQSQQTLHTKGNEKQRKQHQTDEASNPNAASGNEAVRKYKMCTCCKTVEPERRTYKKCSLCKKEGWQQPRFYCSKQCQERDWKAKHNMEHKSGEMLQ